jgi:hypothetical protein
MLNLRCNHLFSIKNKIQFAFRYVLFLCAIFYFHRAFPFTVVTDFKSDQSSFQGWDLTTTDKDDSHGRNFQDNNDYIESPLYDGDVISFSLSAKTFGNDGSSLVVSARKDKESQFEDVFTLSFANNAETNETVSVARSNHFRQFRLTFKKSKGTLRIGSFSVTCRADGEVAIPVDLAAKEIGNNSFVATWAVDENVDYFLVDCWWLLPSPWTGNVVWREGFDGISNEGSSAKKLTDEDFSRFDHGGWSGEWIYAAPGSSGIVQIGKASDEIGYLRSPALPAMQNVELVVRASAYEWQPNLNMDIFCVRSAQTNNIATFELDKSFEDYHCLIPEIKEGDCLLFRSFTTGSQRKVLVDDIALISGFTEGLAMTNYVFSSKRVEYSPSPSLLIENLSENMQYDFSVRAVSSGNISEFSSICSAITTVTDQEKVTAFPLSTIASSHSAKIWTEDFSSLTNVFYDKDNSVEWRNSLTFSHWQAYEGLAPFEELKRNNGNGATAGLYAYWKSDKSVDSYSLGTLTASEKPEYVYGLSFKNDTAYLIEQMSISYDGVQFGFKNENEQQLIFEYRITKELEPLISGEDWKELGALNFTTPKDSSSGLSSGEDVVVVPLSLEDVKIRLQPESYCHIRWRRCSVSKAAAMAIDNVCVTFKERRAGMRVIVR